MENIFETNKGLVIIQNSEGQCQTLSIPCKHWLPIQDCFVSGPELNLTRKLGALRRRRRRIVILFYYHNPYTDQIAKPAIPMPDQGNHEK